MAGNTSQPGATVVSRAVAVLTAFDDTHPRLTLTELARRAGLPLATAHRLAGELTTLGMLTRTPSGHYAVGRTLWQIGLLAPMQTGLREVAAPFLQDLYAATLATIHLAVRDGLRVLYLDRLSGQRSVPVVSRTGSRLAMHATGVGKVLLAHAPEDAQDKILSSLPDHALYDRPARPASCPARGDPDRRLRDDHGGDDPGRLLSSRARPPRRRRRRSLGHRGAEPAARQVPPGVRADRRRAWHRPQPGAGRLI